MLSPQAWNAFLKTLEEPPPRTIFVLATTEAQKVLPTVVDRCHRFDFGRPSVEQVATVLARVAEQESIEIDQGALALIARHATGSFRDALGTLEQLVTYAGGERIEPADVLAVLGIADAEQLFAAVDAIIAARPRRPRCAPPTTLAESGRDPGPGAPRPRGPRARAAHRAGARRGPATSCGSPPSATAASPSRPRRCPRPTRCVCSTWSPQALDATANGAQARIQLELVLIKAAAPEVDPSTAALLARIERLEEGLRSADRPRRGPRRTPAAPAAGRPEPDAGSPRARPRGRPSAGASHHRCARARRRDRLLARRARPRPRRERDARRRCWRRPARSPSASAS